jgi:hypothetical protein
MPYADPEKRRQFHADNYRKHATAMKARASQNHADNRDRRLAGQRALRGAMTATEKAVETARVRKWEADNPMLARIAVVKRKFGITAEALALLYKAQDDKCAICRCSEADNGKWFAVDHDHATGEVRGLLCSTCNSGLGHFKDAPDNLRNAIAYLQKGAVSL